MITETLNIHQALVELKTLDKRIEAAISDGEWVVANKHSNTKISGVDLMDFAENIKSRHQEVTSQILLPPEKPKPCSLYVSAGTWK